MYRELFSLNYSHEYYEDHKGFNLHCKLSPSSNKLSKAMDVVMVAKQGGFKILWNSSYYTRGNLLKTFSGESVVIYLFPVNNDEFFNITDNFPLKIDYVITRNDEKQTLSGPCLHVVVVSNTTTLTVEYCNEPLEKVLYLNSVSDAFRFPEVDLSKDLKKLTLEPELTDLYNLGKRKTAIAVIVPLDNLHRNNAEVYQLAFKAKSVFYKYYFTALSAEQNLKIEPDAESDATNAIHFKVAEPYLNRGIKVPVFVSDKPIKLKHKPSCQYRLVCEVNGVEEIVFETLPQPNVDQYYKHTIPKQEPITVLEAFIN